MSSYTDIKVSESYILVKDTDISSYTTISIEESIDTIQETRTIIYMGTILSLYVIIMALEKDNIILGIEETSEDILVDIIDGRT